jgi:hypothetical protein
MTRPSLSLDRVDGTRKYVLLTKTGLGVKMKISWRTLVHWLPFVFAAYLCYWALWRLSGSDTKVWEPTFYSFLPMCFFFVGVVTFRMEREIRELRSVITKLRTNGTVGNVAA